MAVIEWKIRCTADGKDEVWLLQEGTIPATCPVDTAHTVDLDSVRETGRYDVPKQDESGILLEKPQPQTLGFEMCERDFRLTTCKVTQATAVEDLLMNPVTLKEEPYAGPELSLQGVYKDTGSMVLCADQADADVNGTLTVWDYKAYDQSDGTTEIPYNIRSGAIVIDPAIPTGERFDHRAYIIVAPDLGQANLVRLFDGYVAGRPQEGELSTESPVAKLLDPALAPGANTVRIYVVHPQGQSNNHILWLMTYRPTGK